MHPLNRTGITTRDCACIAGLGCACAGGVQGLGAASSSSSSAVPKILGATMVAGLAIAWVVWFTKTHPLKPEYARAGARF